MANYRAYIHTKTIASSPSNLVLAVLESNNCPSCSAVNQRHRLSINSLSDLTDILLHSIFRGL